MTTNGHRLRAVFVDRDGVLMRSRIDHGQPFPVGSAAEVEILPGVVESCLAFHRAGLLVVMFTNQPDVARGTVTAAAVEAINAELRRHVHVDDVFVCIHDDVDQCDCRKPAPGMLTAAATKWDVSLEHSVVVGDRWRDVEAGRRAGCRTVFVDYGYREARPAAADLVVDSLAEATPWILATCLPVEATAGS